MHVVSRSAWGADPATSSTPIAGPVRGVAIHHGGEEPAPVDHAKCEATVRAYQDYHMGTHGWADIAYNHLVCDHGYVFTGRGYGIRSAAQGTNEGNDSYHAICFIGNGDSVSELALAAFAELIHAYQIRFRGANEVRPHSYFHSTGCPGSELTAWIAARGWKPDPGFIQVQTGRGGRKRFRIGTRVDGKGPLVRATEHALALLRKGRNKITITRHK